RLDAGEYEKGIEWRERRSDVPQGQYAASDGESKVAEGLVQNDTVIFRARFAEHRVALFARPVEGAAIDDNPADRVAVAAEKLGQRMHHNVGAVVDRLAEIGRRKGVVDDQRDARALSDFGDCLDIGDHAAWIGDRFDEDRLSLRAHRALERADVVRLGPDDVPAAILEPMVELID